MNNYLNLSQPGKNRKLKNGYVTDPTKDAIRSYMNIRRSLGFLGIALPVVLMFGSFNNNNNILPSISDYYYTPMRTIFTGIIFALSMFLYHYNSLKIAETLITKAAAAAILCVAIFPTQVQAEYKIVDNVIYSKSNFEGFIKPSIPDPEFVGCMHYAMASIFFGLLIVLVLFNFVKAEKQRDNLKWRIILYRICGYGMLLSILSIISIPLIFENSHSWMFPLIFICETVALILFGISWLIKGEVEELIFEL